MSRTPRLVLQAALGAGLVALALHLWWSDAGRRDPAALLPDVGGPIRLAVTSVNSARRSALRNAQLVSNVVNALPTTSRLLVLTNDLDAFQVHGGAHPGRVRFVELDAKALTIWPQDPFLVLRDAGGGGRLLVPKRFERADDREMARAVAAELGWPVVESELLFEGGNVVSDATTAFVGADTIAANAVELGLDEEEVARRFERTLGRRVQVVGPVPQPVAHIDLVLTPLGEGRVALADPGLGAEIVAGVLAARPDAVAAFEARAELVFFGHASIAELPTARGETLHPPRLAGRTAAIVDYATELAPIFDRLAAELDDRGFEPVRIPALLAPPEASEDDPNEPAPGYPLLGFDNVLLEDDRGERIVYLPRYGLEALDEAAAAAWRGAGYRVVPIDDLLTSASYGGGLRCSVKVLERSTPLAR